MYQCTLHPNSQITAICIDISHECNRKLCPTCVYEHKSSKRPLPIHIFQERLTEKVNEYKLNDKQQQLTNKTTLKFALSDIEERIRKLHQQAIDDSNHILNNIDQQDQQYIHLIQNNANPIDTLHSDLDKLVHMLEGNTLSHWDLQKKSYQTKFTKALNWIAQEINAYEQRFQVEMKNISSIDQIEQQEQNSWQGSTQKKSMTNWDYFDTLYQYRKIKIQILFTQQETQYLRDGQIIGITRDQNKEIQFSDLFNNLEQIQNLRWGGPYGQNKKKFGKWTATWNGQQLKDVVDNTPLMVKNTANGLISSRIIGARRRYTKQENMIMAIGQVIGSAYVRKKRWVEENIIRMVRVVHGLNQHILVKYLLNGSINLMIIIIRDFQFQFFVQQNFFQKFLKCQFQKMYQCTLHPNSQITAICIDISHECNRKLCPTCVYEHKSSKRPLPIHIFQERLTEKVNEYKLNDKQQQLTNKTTLKFALSDIEERIRKLHQQAIDDSNHILNNIDQQDQQYIHLIQNNANPIDTLHSDLDKLVHMLEGNTLSHWDLQKKSYQTKFTKALNWIAQEINAYEQRFQVEMKNISSIDQIEQQEQNSWQGSTQKKSMTNWDYFDTLYQYRKIKIQILFTQQETQYLRDGQIIGVINIKFEMGWSLWTEQKKVWKMDGNLEWITIKGCSGQYSINGKKHGQWIDIIKNYWSQAQVYEVGEYDNGYRIGNWKCVCEKEEVGGGEYNQNGKSGTWIELSNEFWQRSQVTYNGEYKNNNKVGRWNILYREKGKEMFEEIGGGSYDKGGQIKIGQWIELSDGFWDYSQFIFKGDYKNGRKVGKWSTWYRKDDKFEQIGGGQYDEEGSIKIGRWMEIRDGFWLGQQLIYLGQYQKNCKVGRWDIMYRPWNQEKFEIIGGGSYDGETSNKIGNWIEMSDGFKAQQQITYNGQYKNGKKVGRWDIWYKDNLNGEREKIGGGLYDDGTSKKNGSWIELSYGFHYQQQIIYSGQYKNDKKIGKWEEIDLVGMIKLKEIIYTN
ncbi:unnamed protein product [Paramecium octaurelia]|uniref:Uncharacterized protein n=1 Tax=Paramecium octaurelia TaxID=43137 RepID=A0A8S1W276_PAROT|nr:unnamed protein product [Paramecium octaurelia]